MSRSNQVERVCELSSCRSWATSTIPRIYGGGGGGVRSNSGGGGHFNGNDCVTPSDQPVKSGIGDQIYYCGV